MTIEAQSIRFLLADPAEPGRSTTRRLQIRIDGEPAWPMSGLPEAALEIQVDDLLAFLTENWKPLLLRQTYPAALNPFRPSQLRSDALKLWDGMPIEISEPEEDAVSGFEEAHDLSLAFAGLFNLPSFWLVRLGETFRLESQGRLWVMPYDQVVKELTELGDRVVALLRDVGEKWTPLLDAWGRRTEGEGTRLLAWATGIDFEEARTLIHEGMLVEPATFAEAANDNDELRIAARMAGALPIEQIREILVLARNCPKREAADLKELAANCSREIRGKWAARPPYVQGEVAARLVRDTHRIEPDAACDVQALLEHLAVYVQTADLEPETFDGLAIWGANHGPGVVLNLASERVSESDPQVPGCDPALRVTLAHEFCHLLLDGGHTVTAVDVLRSRMPVAIEQRAKSFAGELLLPARTAARWWQDMGSPRHREGLRGALQELERTFQVPRAVSTWKLDHGLRSRGLDLSELLASLSRYR